MEVCTTNNSNNSNEHHHHHQLTTTTTTSSSNMLRGSPFQREVREWQRIDPTTGALLTGRLEADRWINGPLNSYGKISDSQNIAQPNGLQQTQRKQLEVLQSHTANGAMQVIRARTVQTTSSRWSSNNSSATTSPTITAAATKNSITNGYHHQHLHQHHHSSLFNNSLITNVNHYNYNGNSNSNKNNSHMLLQQQQQQVMAPQLQISSVGSDVDCDIDDDVDVIVDYTDVHGIENDVDVDADAYADDDDDYQQKEEANHRLHLINKQRNSNSSSSIGNSNIISSNSNNLLSNFLLLDTAPSLKLSNLMKSSSSVSTNSNSSTATTASNMHLNSNSSSSSINNNNRSGGKISLHTIVGNKNNNDTLLSSTSSSSTIQQQQRSSRLYEQHPTFGKINSNSNSSSFIKSRVGGGGGGASSSINADAQSGGVGEKLQQHQYSHQYSQQQQQTLTPTQPLRQQRRDLESFRHYNDDDDDDQHNADADDADTLRLSSRHQRRQQIPTTSSLYSNSTLQRGRSISTDDLSTEWDPHGDQSTHDEPSEWRRVSKLRRSFQSSATKPNNDTYSTTPTATTTTILRRPIDLPESSVNVSKIRAELEAGRRLTTAMRNNHVDLAALQNILDAPTAETKSTITKRNSFLTAESLKEIRGRLKKLSDESLYKEDFIIQQTEPPAAQVERIEVQYNRKPSISPPPRVSTTQRRSLISPDKSPEIQRSAFQFVTPQRITPALTTSSVSTHKQHTTNSLESRLKSRDTSSAEWHLRRKSYGFEKMSPPDDRSMFRMDASTDSGLGRSGELANWSPTETANTTRATVVQFGVEPARLVTKTTAIQRRQRALRSSDPDDSSDELKRHSIAVDESHYVRKTSQVHLNGFPGTVTESTTLEATRYDTDSPPNSSSQLFQRSTQQKRVEFCKTEVHFAAESGRVNIVETDGKPPPTNNFRRRRRTTSGPLESLVKATAAPAAETAQSSIGNVAMPVTRFGDDNRLRTIASSTVAYKAALVDATTAEVIEPSSVTVSLPKEPFAIGEGSRSSYTSTSGIDTTDNENDEIAAIRGILKNKPIKPKPYHLGENFETADALWGIQLKPISSATTRDSGATKANSPPLQALSKSVAEHVRIVERRQDTSTSAQAQNNGYSTKINLSLGETAAPEWKPEQGMNYLPTAPQSLITKRRPSAQELLLQDLKEHQKILDEGLKSTSLIIKTMRSANEFDEAMRRLSIASIESTVMPQIVVPTPMLRSNSYQETIQRRYATATSLSDNEHEVMRSTSYSSNSSRKYSTDSLHSLFAASPPPTAAPRLKLIGNTQVPVSQQLSQLRRLYEVAAAQNGRDDADSADEEVKHYFRGHPDNSDSGGGTQESSSLEDERTPFEYSSSWSRLKAKRTIWKIEAEEEREVPKQQHQQQQQESSKTNVMNIELHSPQATLEKPIKAAPVAKPRTLPSATLQQQYETDSNRSIDSTSKEHLKIVKEARGARKLREHELSYFGVQVPSTQTANATKTKSYQTAIQTTTTTNPRRTLPQRHRVRDDDITKSTETRNDRQTTKWNLVNDKPDLLRHSPMVIEPPQAMTRTTQIKSTDKQKQKIFNPVKRIQYSDNDDDDDADDDDEHFYENITNEISSVITVKPPPAANDMHAYNRKTDLERDERILSEMTHNADQTMKALSDEAAIKDQRRRSSLTRRHAKPLATITEKAPEASIPINVSRSTVASEARRMSRHSTPSPTPLVICSRMRTSSQSSTESCPPRARSRSLSSEREYENIKVRPTTRSNTKSQKPTVAKHSSRSSSRDSQRSSHTPQISSGDEREQQLQHNNGCRRDERLRTKTKRISSSSATKAQQEARRQREHERREKQERALRLSSATTNMAATHKEKSTKSGSTTRSSQRERVECATTDSSRRHRRDGELDPHRRSSSSRRATTTTAAAAADKSDEKRSGNRLVRSMRSSTHHNYEQYDAATTQRSSNRSERSVKDKDREKLSRSKGHSSQATQQNSSSSNNHEHNPHHHQHQHYHQQHQHTSSPTSSSANKARQHSSNSSEHKKSKSSSHYHDSTTAMLTHGKNAQILNGISAQNNQHHHKQQQQLQQQQQQQQHYHQHPQQHIHSMTTATITGKPRERHSKDRK